MIRQIFAALQGFREWVETPAKTKDEVVLEGIFNSDSFANYIIGGMVKRGQTQSRIRIVGEDGKPIQDPEIVADVNRVNRDIQRHLDRAFK